MVTTVGRFIANQKGHLGLSSYKAATQISWFCPRYLSERSSILYKIDYVDLRSYDTMIFYVAF